LAAGLAASSGAHAQPAAPGAPESAAEAAACRVIADDAARLACYDRRFGRELLPVPTAPLPTPAAAATAPAPGTARALAAAEPAGGGLKPAPSPLSQFWELDEADKRGTFRVLTYQPNYLLPLNLSNRVNLNPQSPTQPSPGVVPDYRSLEAMVQLSLRLKVAEGLVLPRGDLWFTYTHRAQWQIWSGGISRPFRNTDYEPGLVYVLPVPAGLQPLPGGWRWRLLTADLTHQSNGQTDPLSRSWNRVGLGTGIERDSLSLQAQLWRRLREGQDDNNPDLTDHIGRGELRAAWLPGRATASLAWRSNFQDWDRGSVQFDWTYPVSEDQPQGLRWYLRLFHGYGESLLDYNFRKTSLGLGVTLFAF
jgi:phospholipase A1